MAASDEFQKQLLQTFKIEAEEHLTTLSNGLIELENKPNKAKSQAIVEEIHRAAHSLKSAARAVELVDVASLCHAMENVFSEIKNHSILLSEPLFDTLQNALNSLQTLLCADSEQTDAGSFNSLLKQLEKAAKGEPSDLPAQAKPKRKPGKKKPSVAKKSHKPEAKAEEPPEPMTKLPDAASVLPDTIRVSNTKLKHLLFQLEELFPAKHALNQCADEAKDLLNALYRGEKKQGQLKPLTSKMQRLAEHLDQEKRLMSNKLDNLLNQMKNILLQPLTSLLQSFPKFVRNLAHDQAKKVKLEIKGGEIEIDRRIIEEIYDPLIHILKNSVDHGIEMPETRTSANKSPEGTITILVEQTEGGHIQIKISDDGAGINFAKVQSKIKELGMISKDKKDYNEHELIPYIFKSGVTTSPIVTELSGRGLGLAIALEKTEKLGGSIDVETLAGKGTSIRFDLPITLATFRGLLVEVNDQQFIFPTPQIIQCLRMRSDAITSIEHKKTLSWQGKAIPLVHLEEILEMPGSSNPYPSEIHVVLLKALGNTIAVCVDNIINEDEILVKNFNPQLLRVRNILGATLLQNREPIPILHITDIVRSALKEKKSASFSKTYEKPQEVKEKSVLVVEDSITARTLLKNILESAGYIVTTAIDGLDAFTQLKQQPVDIVVSDVLMPRMDGFELTEKIRKDNTYSDLPVVLVTSLEKREDRERGIDVGANAYIVKSDFDQSNLLEIVGRLA